MTIATPNKTSTLTFVVNGAKKNNAGINTNDQKKAVILKNSIIGGVWFVGLS